MNSRLGIFDSGLGGITVLQRVLDRHGDLPFLYLADTARVPYGERSSLEIRNIASEVIHWFCEQDISAVLVACNTTNSLALDVVEEFVDVPVFGLIEAAANMIYEDKVGVLATPATAASKAYRLHIEACRPGTEVLEQACPAFVPLIEEGLIRTNEIKTVARKYLEPLLDAKVEAVVMGCSHYPLLEPLLRQLIPAEVGLVDPAIGLAYRLDSLLGRPKPTLGKVKSFSNTHMCVTSDPIGFGSRASIWLGKCPDVELVTLRSKAGVF